MWPNFDGKPYTRTELATRINACDFSQWKRKDGSRGKPAFITLHNTSVPDIALWMSWSPQTRQQYMFNTQEYYENMGWRGGPHFFVTPQPEICAFGFNDLMAAGTHASCFNNLSIGIEMVGEFDRERFDSGYGAQVADNAIYLLALLHKKIGLTPAPYAYNQRGLHFHVECAADDHHCPGDYVEKTDIVARITAKMAELAGAPPPAPGAPAMPVAAAGAAAPAALPTATIDQICTLAGDSDIATYYWKNRGEAPAGYIKGMAVVFADLYRRLKAGDPIVAAMAAAETANADRDALAWYRAVFAAADMSNAAAGAVTLRHLFVLLLGLGMRESSGRYCEGRDISAENTSSDTAEAGLFQMSWDSHVASPLIPQLFATHSASSGDDGCLSIFQEGVDCGHGDLANYGDGTGAAFQRLCKSRPAFAAETAAVGLRVARSHWGPIRSRAAEIRAEADDMLQRVQAIVDGTG